MKTIGEELIKEYPLLHKLTIQVSTKPFKYFLPIGLTTIAGGNDFRMLPRIYRKLCNIKAITNLLG